MTDMLRDPVWNGIAGIVAIIALLLSIKKEKIDLIPFTQRAIVVISRAMIGVLILLPSMPLQYTISNILQGGLPLMQDIWQMLIARIGMGGVLRDSFSYAFLPGIVSALVASNEKTLKLSIKQTIIALFVTLSVADVYIYMTGYNFALSHFGLFIFSLFSNIIGGIIAGPIIAYFVQVVNTAFTSASVKNNAG